MTPQEVRALALFCQLSNLSPDDGEVDAHLTLHLGNGKLMGKVYLSSRDMEALTDAVASLRAYAQDSRDGGEPADLPVMGSSMADEAESPELHPEALAEIEEHLASIELGDWDGGA